MWDFILPQSEPLNSTVQAYIPCIPYTHRYKKYLGGKLMLETICKLYFTYIHSVKHMEWPCGHETCLHYYSSIFTNHPSSIYRMTPKLTMCNVHIQNLVHCSKSITSLCTYVENKNRCKWEYDWCRYYAENYLVLERYSTAQTRFEYHVRYKG